jgi:hypothetical protein
MRNLEQPRTISVQSRLTDLSGNLVKEHVEIPSKKRMDLLIPNVGIWCICRTVMTSMAPFSISIGWIRQPRIILTSVTRTGVTRTGVTRTGVTRTGVIGRNGGGIVHRSVRRTRVSISISTRISVRSRISIGVSIAVYRCHHVSGETIRLLAEHSFPKMAT